MFNFFSSATTLAAFLSLGSALTISPYFKAASHRVHTLRSEPNVSPLSGAIKFNYINSTNTSVTVKPIKPQNVSTYLLGKVPNPADDTSLVSFIAEFDDNDNVSTSSYYVPPRGSVPGSEIANAVPNRSFQVHTNGTAFRTPGTVVSGRLYIANDHLNFFTGPDGMIVEPDPHNPNDIASQQLWGFVELTYGSEPSNDNVSLTVNLSFVDWISLPLGMNVTFQETNGSMSYEYIPGLRPDGLNNICRELSSMSSFWPKLCLNSTDNVPLRVMSPEKYVSLNPTDKDATDYWEPYVHRIWNKYKTTDLQINTQASSPEPGSIKVDDGQIVTCRVLDDDHLHCNQDAGNFTRPTSVDIWGCNSGPFAGQAGESWSRARVRPRLCAAFTRSTLDFNATQPSQDIRPDKYYRGDITNHYARLVHENLIGGMGYAFSYDDVNPDSAENTAGLISREASAASLALDILINMDGSA